MFKPPAGEIVISDDDEDSKVSKNTTPATGEKKDVEAKTDAEPKNKTDSKTELETNNIGSELEETIEKVSGDQVAGSKEEKLNKEIKSKAGPSKIDKSEDLDQEAEKAMNLDEATEIKTLEERKEATVELGEESGAKNEISEMVEMTKEKNETSDSIQTMETSTEKVDPTEETRKTEELMQLNEPEDNKMDVVPDINLDIGNIENPSEEKTDKSALAEDNNEVPGSDRSEQTVQKEVEMDTNEEPKKPCDDTNAELNEDNETTTDEPVESLEEKHEKDVEQNVDDIVEEQDKEEKTTENAQQEHKEPINDENVVTEADTEITDKTEIPETVSEAGLQGDKSEQEVSESKEEVINLLCISSFLSLNLSNKDKEGFYSSSRNKDKVNWVKMCLLLFNALLTVTF